MIPGSVVWFTLWKEGMSSTWTWAGLRGGLMMFNKAKCEVLNLVRENTGINTGWGEEWIESSPEEEDLGADIGWQVQHDLAMCSHSPEGQP